MGDLDIVDRIVVALRWYLDLCIPFETKDTERVPTDDNKSGIFRGDHIGHAALIT